MNCPSIERLFAFANGDVPSEEGPSIRRHLDTGCGECREQVGRLGRVLSAASASGFIEPPAWLIDQAQALFCRVRPVLQDYAAKGFAAFLVADSFAVERLAGFRGSGPLSRQILYRAGDYDIDLSMDSVGPSQSVDIIGQSMPLTRDLTSVADACVELINGTGVAVATRVNQFGEFILDGIREGTYEMRIKLKDEEIFIPRLEAKVRSHAGQVVN